MSSATLCNGCWSLRMHLGLQFIDLFLDKQPTLVLLVVKQCFTIMNQLLLPSRHPSLLFFFIIKVHSGTLIINQITFISVMLSTSTSNSE